MTSVVFIGRRSKAEATNHVEGSLVLAKTLAALRLKRGKFREKQRLLPK